MPLRRLVVLTILVWGWWPAAFAQDVSHAALRDELIAMREQDQRYRMPGEYNEELATQADRANRSRLREIIKDLGWPTLPMVGKTAAQGAWLIVQHADDEPDFQKQILSLITPLAESGLVPKEHVAYLHDRVNKPQRYGTQGACVGQGKWQPREIEEPALVDERRKAMGMQSLSEYIQTASRFLCVKP